jgi:hypothetical protein
MKLLQCLGLIALAAAALAGQAQAQTSHSIIGPSNEDHGAPNIVFNTRTGDRLLSRDGAQTWSAKSPGAENVKLLRTANTDGRPVRIVYNQRGGARFVSRDGGVTWKDATSTGVQPMTPPAPQKAQQPASPQIPAAMSIDPHPAEVMAAQIVELTRNPTSGETSIVFKLAQASSVDLGIYDESGNLVMSVLDGDQKEGTQSVSVNAGKLGPGVFYCRLSVPGATSIAKLVVTK